ncbi:MULTISPECIES: hypothetical protein [unclassified Mesorhizobium]|uniref:hypothetical protein n=1 Tax=unclassified Mesorhizobium TaxID=325217 RepID=UPI0010935959|nr:MULTISPECIES: hypothetical protein [unclassified Mesorhizobium]TGV22127.1 hypothetical protein EN786_30790 [Mesorhizobium sp. M4B.F.Ca.ET.143.01.1.1]
MILIQAAVGNNLAGKDAFVIGRSNIVGKPMVALQGAAQASVTSKVAKCGALHFFGLRFDVDPFQRVNQPILANKEKCPAQIGE